MAIRVVEVSGAIAAPRARVHELIVDVVAMAWWNPAFDRCEWMDGATEAADGVRFRVWNVDARFDWSVDEFEIRSVGDDHVTFVRIHEAREAARWSFTVSDGDDGGATVTMRHDVYWEPFLDRLRSRLGDPEKATREAMELSLHGLRTAAEATADQA